MINWFLLIILYDSITSGAVGARSSRIIRTKQGNLRGIVLAPDHNHLGQVEAFLGVPYAAPPLDRLRFMPPTSPLRYTSKIRSAADFGPVCPQIIPDLTDRKIALKFMSVGRLAYLERLFPLLKNQNEDCLYLNIYVPKRNSYVRKNSDLSVIVFIHGESYEWNSGNPYDGSVLASYGQVIFITINYRLGILGFLRPGLNDQNSSGIGGNFALLDQVAALHWIQENVAEFGGNPRSVTVLGHGTGANLVSLLLTSPVLHQKDANLFHRVVLMSGTSLSPTAMTHEPTDITIQVANSLGCPLQSNKVGDCLRSKHIDELLNAPIKMDLYLTPFGPIVDGIVVPASPFQLMKNDETFGKFDLMAGLVSSEAFHLFPDATVTFGVTEKEQRSILRSFLRSNYRRNMEQTLLTIVNEYTDPTVDVTSSHLDNALHNRNTMLDMFSDALISAPVIKTVKLHSESARSKGGSTYLYVFKHVTKYGYYSDKFGSVHGEEIAYMLGMPLVGGTFHFLLNYTQQEEIIAEILMNALLNFVAKGDVNEKQSYRRHFLSSQDIPSWPSFNPNSQKYLSIGSSTIVKSHYRPHKMALWNRLIPQLAKSTSSQNKSSPHVNTDNHYEWLPGPTTVTVEDDNIYAARSETVPVTMVLFIGLTLFVLNMCACAVLSYQRKRVSQREDQLRIKLKQLTDSGINIEDEVTDDDLNYVSEGFDSIAAGNSHHHSFRFPKAKPIDVNSIHPGFKKELKSALKRNSSCSTEETGSNINPNEVKNSVEKEVQSLENSDGRAPISLKKITFSPNLTNFATASHESKRQIENKAGPLNANLEYRKSPLTFGTSMEYSAPRFYNGGVRYPMYNQACYNYNTIGCRCRDSSVPYYVFERQRQNNNVISSKTASTASLPRRSTGKSLNFNQKFFQDDQQLLHNGGTKCDLIEKA